VTDVRQREFEDHRCAGAISRCAVCGNRILPLRVDAFQLAARTETAYRLEASNCSVPLQRSETIEPMLIRDVAVDFALAHAP
jgi:hypothetical protein